MEGCEEQLSGRRDANQDRPLDAIQRWAELRKSGNARAQVTPKVVGGKNRRRVGFDLPKGTANFKDKRKWDYKSLGYADKCYYPRDYSRHISPELQRFYGEQEEGN